MAHEREYAGAVEGMRETYGSMREGDFVTGTAGGKTFAGHVLTIDGDRVSVDCWGAWLSVSVGDIETFQALTN